MQRLKYPLIKPNIPTPDKWINYLDESYQTHTFGNFGPAARKLQNRLKDFLKLPLEPLIFCNATLALEIVLEALDVRDREVLTPSYTFAASALSIERTGGLPVLVDNDLDTWHLDLRDAEKRLTTKTKVMLLVHPLGMVKDLSTYLEFCNKHNLKLVVDAAASLGASYNQSNWSDAIHVFSLHATKSFGIGEGSLVTSNDSKFLETLRKLSNFGLNERAETELLGTNAKMSDFQAAVGLGVLDNFEENQKLRKIIAKQYDQNLKNCIPQTLEPKSHSYSMYPFRYLGDIDKLKERLEANSIGYRQYYRPLHWHPRYRNNRDLPNADLLGKTIFCIPCYETLSPGDVEFISDIINQ